MRKMWKDIVGWYFWAKYCFDHELMFEQYGEGSFNHVEWWLDFILQELKFLWCAFRGHDYQSTGGWATPDSGGDEFTCTRCGHEISHTYY